MHPSSFSSSFSHSCCQIKCQTDREGGWMAHISPIEVHTVWYSTFQTVCALLFLSHRSALIQPSALHLSPPSGSLAADWVVIVIKSSCTARESTKLSANGWSFWWEDGLERGHGHCPTEPPPTQCLPVFLTWGLFM